MKTVLFDLDGTIIDSGPGIMNCTRHAFETLGFPVPRLDILQSFVGPPLRNSFQTYGIPEELTDEAIRIFRKQYQLTGKFEIEPYSQVEWLLKQLKEDGFQLCIATSKPESLAIDILHRIKLDIFFDIICGATMSSERETKSDVIAYLLTQISSVSDIIMVGDTHYDVIGAKFHGIPAIGVSWGYGDTASMLEAGAKCVVSSMSELYTAISC